MSTREGESWDYLRSLPIALSNLTVVFVQLLSCVRLFVIQWTTACQASLSFTITWSLLKLKSIESVMLSNHLILCQPLLLLPSIFPSIRIFSSELALLMRWPKYWSFSFSNIPSKEIPGLISFSMDWLDLLAVQYSSDLGHTSYYLSKAIKYINLLKFKIRVRHSAKRLSFIN